LYEQVDTEDQGQAISEAGMGDLSLAVKVDFTTGEDELDVALVGVVTFPTAPRDIGLGSEQFSLGATAGWSLAADHAVALYANVDLLDGHATWTISPNWSIALSDSVGAYLEAGYQLGDAPSQADNFVGGGGLTWMVTPVMQVDAYVLAGLTGSSTDLSAGCGVSVFFP
jgi:Putative MetA-pathway of phenol degradation